MENWVEFYRERRLRHMLRLVNDSRLTDMGERVAKNMDKMFEGIQVLNQSPSALMSSPVAVVPHYTTRTQWVQAISKLAGVLHAVGCCAGEALVAAWRLVVRQSLSSGGWAVGNLRPCLLLWYVPCPA